MKNMEDESVDGGLIQERLNQNQNSSLTQDQYAGQADLIPEDMTLTVGIPCNTGEVKAQFMASFINMIAGNGCVKHLEWANSGPIHRQRNHLVMAALERGVTHLLMLDSDMVMPPNLIPGLARHRQPVVGALCFKRWAPYTPTLYLGEPGKLSVMMRWPEGLVRVTATGAAAMLIDVGVFANLEHPWFRDEEDSRGKTIGEDIGFCYRCHEADVPVYVDTTIECGHMGEMNFNSHYYAYAQMVCSIEKEDLDAFLKSKLPDQRQLE